MRQLLRYGRLCRNGGRRSLRNQLGDDRGKLRSHAAPIGDALVLQVNRGRVSAGIVGADDLDRTAVPGAVLLDNHDTIIGLLGGANTRQTNHHHGDTVPFKSCALLRSLGVRRLCAMASPNCRLRLQASIAGLTCPPSPHKKPVSPWKVVHGVEDTTPKYRRNRAFEASLPALLKRSKGFAIAPLKFRPPKGPHPQRRFSEPLDIQPEVMDHAGRLVCYVD
jgi:hypothetical protein